MWKVIAAVVALLVLACAGVVALGGYGAFEVWRLEQVESEVAEAAARIDEAEAVAEERRDAACEEGQFAYAAKDYGRAVERLDECVELDPGNAASLLTRGKSYAQLERFERAEADIDRAAALDGTNAEAWKALAWVRVRLADDAGAIAAADRWVALEPGAAEAYQLRADAAYRQGLVELAVRDATQACDLGLAEGCLLKSRMRP